MCGTSAQPQRYRGEGFRGERVQMRLDTTQPEQKEAGGVGQAPLPSPLVAITHLQFLV